MLRGVGFTDEVVFTAHERRNHNLPRKLAAQAQDITLGNDMENLAEYLKVFIAIYVLVNPLEGIPIYLARSQGMTQAQRLAIARTTSIAVAVILWVALAIGHVVLQLLGISVGAFTLAGGIIIFLIALKMVLGPSGGDDDSGSGAADGSFAIVPLAIPLLAGPGPISSVIVYASKGITHHGASLTDDLILAGIILVVAVATFIALAVADPARRLLGDTGINVFTRISGILVAAIAVGLVVEGLGMLYPGLAAAR
jgi:multiple antibiotic resistance protein